MGEDMQKMMFSCFVSLFIFPTMISAESVLKVDHMYSFEEMEAGLIYFKRYITH